MIIGLSVALGLTIIASFIVLDRQGQRAVELDAAHRLQIAGLTGLLEREGKAYREQIQILCNRIQAPQQAVMQSLVDQAGPDETFPLTDEESAEAQERALAIEQIERMEREGILQ